MILQTSEMLWDFVCANKMGVWIEEGCDCGERMGEEGSNVVFRIWTILMELASLYPLQI